MKKLLVLISVLGCSYQEPPRTVFEEYEPNLDTLNANGTSVYTAVLTERQKKQLEEVEKKARYDVVERAEHCKRKLEVEREAAEELTARAREAVAWAKANCELYVSPPVVAMSGSRIVRLPLDTRFDDCHVEGLSGSLALANIAVAGKLNKVVLSTDSDKSCD